MNANLSDQSKKCFLKRTTGKPGKPTKHVQRRKMKLPQIDPMRMGSTSTMANPQMNSFSQHRDLPSPICLQIYMHIYTHILLRKKGNFGDAREGKGPPFSCSLLCQKRRKK